MRVEKIERLFLNAEDWEKWNAFWYLTEEIMKASEKDGKLSEMLSNIQDTINEIEDEFFGKE